MRSPFIFAALSLLVTSSRVSAPNDRPARNPGCSVENVLYDTLEIVCPLREAQPSLVYRFQVNFSGGHDDTQASLLPTLNDSPLACAVASKTRLIGEEGNVSLYCEFRFAANEAAQVFRAKVTWSHAEYVDQTFSARAP